MISLTEQVIIASIVGTSLVINLVHTSPPLSQVELSAERCRAEETSNRLGSEVERLQERLGEKTDQLARAEETLQAAEKKVQCVHHWEQL